MGLLDFFGLGSKKITPQTPNFSVPTLDQASPQTKSLRERAALLNAASQQDLGDVLSGRAGDQFRGIGFGRDFTSLANPAIKRRLEGLREEEIPEIANAASSRGLGRSTVATSQIARASRQAQGDIAQMVANFELLNRQAAKGEIQGGFDLSQNLQRLDVGQSNKAADFSRDASKQFRAEELTRIDQENAENDRVIQALGQVLRIPGLGNLASSFNTRQSQGISQSPTAIQQMLSQPLTRTLNNTDSTASILGALKGGF